MKRLNLKYPLERVPLSWDFRTELDGHAVKSVSVFAVSVIGIGLTLDNEPESILDSSPWAENGVVFQLVKDGLAGADYKVYAIVERDDGAKFQKISVLPVREA